MVGEDEPAGVDDAGDVEEQGEEQVDPEVETEPDLEKSGQRWKEDAADDFKELHGRVLTNDRRMTSRKSE